MSRCAFVETLRIDGLVATGNITREFRVSAMSTFAVVQHEEQRQRYEAKLRRELGELVLSHLADARTEDILLNPDSVLWIKRIGEGFVSVGEMPPAQAASALNTIAAWRGTSLNHERPVLETELPLDGSRFEGLVAPVVRRPVFAIRLRPKQIFTLEQYESEGILTDKADPLNRVRSRASFLESIRGLPHGEIIRRAIAAKRNILVVGATGSGNSIPSVKLGGNQKGMPGVVRPTMASQIPAISLRMNGWIRVKG